MPGAKPRGKRKIKRKGRGNKKLTALGISMAVALNACAPAIGPGRPSGNGTQWNKIPRYAREHGPKKHNGSITQEQLIEMYRKTLEKRLKRGEWPIKEINPSELSELLKIMFKNSLGRSRKKYKNQKLKEDTKDNSWRKTAKGNTRHRQRKPASKT